MNKLLTIFFLYLVTAKASAQLNTFESGQTIRADEMNENFSRLEEDIASLVAKQNPPPVPCAASSVKGRWITALVWDNDREFISFIFDSSNRVVYYSVTEAFGEVEVAGEYSVDDTCVIRLEATSAEFGEIYVVGVFSNDGNSMVSLFERKESGRWTSGTMIRSKYKRP